MGNPSAVRRFSTTFELHADTPGDWIVEPLRWRRPMRELVTIHASAIEKRDPLDLLVAVAALAPNVEFVWRSTIPGALAVYLEDLVAEEFGRPDDKRISLAVELAFKVAQTNWFRLCSTSTEITTRLTPGGWALRTWPLPNVNMEE
jgi:hypothetical protein